MKGAFLIGEKYGRGFASCRLAAGGWSAPAAIAIEGGSFGPQLGASSTDLIMLMMDAAGMKKLLGDKFTVGGEVISYSHTKGLFAGLSLEGATLRPDGGENKKLYGHEMENGEILMGKVPPPKGAKAFVSVLNRRARKGK
jgi:lipid-binding SYLF domain-containing protein